MKKILVPCDFSKPSVSAFRFALEVAARANGTVHLLNVVELPVLHDTILMPVLNFEEEFFRELKEKTQKAFSKVIAKYNKEDVKIESSVLLGSVFPGTLDFIEQNNIDLVVMGSHGVGGVRELFVGSNAEKIVRNSPVPVLVLKDYSRSPIKNIVFPNALETEHQEDLTMKVKALQAFFKAHLNVVWINTPSGFISDSITMKRLESFAKRFMLKDYSLHIFNDIDLEEGILAFAGTVKGDLITMATHGRKGIRHLLNGSLAEDVANHTNRPVWTYSLKNEGSGG